MATGALNRILLVEDDRSLGQQIQGHLTEDGFEVEWLLDGDAALRAQPQAFALVVLDLMLPGAYGLDVLKAFRETADTPVLVLSARNDTADKVRALSLGADDFVTKPFWPEELLARVHARLRRPALQRGEKVAFGPLSIDFAGRRVEVDGHEQHLTRVEFELLAALARRPGDALSRDWLVHNVLDPEREGGGRTLDVHISRLRKKLGSAAGALATVWGVGYRLEAPAAPAP